MSIFNNIKNLFNVNQQAGQTAQTNSQSTSKKKVLLVDDDKDLKDFYTDLLLSAGFDVRVASNGQEGLGVATAYLPDLIILDLLMPIMDGKTMLHKLREIPQFKTVPVIILTNQGDIDSMNETKIYGNASDFIVKANATPQSIIEKVTKFSGIVQAPAPQTQT